MTLLGATSPNQRGIGSYGNEEVLRIPKSSSISGTSSSNCLVSYTGNSFRCGGLTSLQRYSRCILQHQSTWQVCVCVRVCVKTVVVETKPKRFIDFFSQKFNRHELFIS